MVLFSLVLLAAALLVLVAPAPAFVALEQLTAAGRSVPVVSLSWAAVAAIGAALLLILLEFWPRRPEGVFEAQMAGGIVGHPARAIAAAVEQEAGAVEGVREARARIRGRGQEVDVFLRLVVDATHDTRDVATQAADRVRDRVEALGLHLRQPRITVERTEPPDRRIERPAA